MVLPGAHAPSPRPLRAGPGVRRSLRSRVKRGFGPRFLQSSRRPPHCLTSRPGRCLTGASLDGAGRTGHPVQETVGALPCPDLASGSVAWPHLAVG